MKEQTFKVTFTFNGEKKERIIEGWIRLGQLLESLGEHLMDPNESVKDVKVEVGL